ncbi:MAG: hypothetical protein ACREFX_11275, partial [Opitutaceae bacterium]
LDWVLPAETPAQPPQTTVPAGTGPAHLINLSARGLVESANALVAGFVISGSAAAGATLLVRAAGPSLQTVGVPAAQCIAATRLQIYSASGQVVAANTGWTSAPDGGAGAAQAAAESGAFPLVSWAGGGGDSALVDTLPPGAYTAVVSPAPGLPAADLSGKIGLVEIYDLSPANGNRLVNLSCRGAIGAESLVLGLTVSGPGSERLLLRGAGPALSLFGISPVLTHPALTLFDSGGGELAANAGWSASAQADQIATLGAEAGAFPFASGGADAALVALAAPGSVTATLAAAPGYPAQGTGLIEVYAAP